MCLSVFVFHDRGEVMANVPRTLRQKLMMEREELYEMRDTIHKAIMQLIAGESVVSYTLQNRSCTKTRADLSSLKAFLKEIDESLCELEALLSGRPLRQRSVHTYISPANTIPPFLW